jgi:hypothetical protein
MIRAIGEIDGKPLTAFNASSVVAGIVPDKFAASALKQADCSARVDVQEFMSKTWGGATIRAALFPILHFRLRQLLLVPVSDHRSIR